MGLRGIGSALHPFGCRTPISLSRPSCRGHGSFRYRNSPQANHPRPWEWRRLIRQCQTPKEIWNPLRWSVEYFALVAAEGQKTTWQENPKLVFSCGARPTTELGDHS